MTVLVTGGSGSGKSLLAEEISFQLKRNPFYYLATMQIWDEECRKRIARHREQRAGKGFQTVETPMRLAEAAQTLTPGGTALLDCISNLTANEQFGAAAPDPVQAVVNGVLAVQKRLTHLVIVTNEVCSDIPPEDMSMQAYLQNIGRINCALAKAADVVIEVCSGIPIFWKGEEQYYEILV